MKACWHLGIYFSAHRYSKILAFCLPVLQRAGFHLLFLLFSIDFWRIRWEIQIHAATIASTTQDS